VLGTAGAWIAARRRAFTWALLLWLPVPFYAYSVAYGSVPIFLPAWWPHSWYNTRYGMELLPALALGVGFAASFAIGAVRDFKPKWAKYAACILFALVALMRGRCCASVRWLTWKGQRTSRRIGLFSSRFLSATRAALCAPAPRC